MWTVQTWSNFGDNGARPVPYLQLVSPVLHVIIGCGEMGSMQFDQCGSTIIV